MQVNFAMIFDGLTFHFCNIMMTPCFFGCYKAVKNFLPHSLHNLDNNCWKNSVLEGFVFAINMWRIYLKHVLPVLKNVNNVIHTFLRNNKLDRNFPLTDSPIALHQFINWFMWSLSVSVTGHILYYWSHKSALLSSPSLHGLSQQCIVVMTTQALPAFSSIFQQEGILQKSKIQSWQCIDEYLLQVSISWTVATQPFLTATSPQLKWKNRC